MSAASPDRLSGSWIGKGRAGVKFLDGHSYSRDLDLFGRGSVFEAAELRRAPKPAKKRLRRMAAGACAGR